MSQEPAGLGGSPPPLRVRGEDSSGAVALAARLGHGDDPVRLLATAGWQVVRPLGVDLDTGSDVGPGPASPGTPARGLVLRYQVRPRTGSEPASSDPAAASSPAGDPGLRVGPGEEPVPFQRVAAYAVVECPAGVLLTQLSGLTNSAGRWGLPGGGLEPGEHPGAGVVREVWEETGQRVEAAEFLGVQSAHWVGRSPRGRLEDFHAVRLLYRGHCAEPGTPVVHDVGGTTAAAAWVPWDEVLAMDLTPGSRAVLTSALPHRGGVPGRPAR